MDQVKSKRAFTTAEVAELFNVEHITVQKWCAAGTLKSYRTGGGHYRIDRAELISFLSSRNKYVPGLTPVPKNVRVLLVEDDTMTRRYLRRLIGGQFPDIDIHEAIEGYEAGYKTILLKPDLIILDLLLPGMNGIRICKLIRANDELKGVKIVAISGYKPDKMERVVLKAGANLFLKKPLNNKDIVQAISRLLGVKSKVGHST